MLEKKSNYNQSCDNIELELQKLINTALSTTVNNTIHDKHMVIDNEDGDRDDRFLKNKSFKWKQKILDYLKSLNNNANYIRRGEGKYNKCKDDLTKSSISSSTTSSSTSFLNIFNVNNLIYNYYNTNKIVITDPNTNQSIVTNSKSRSKSSSLSQYKNNPLIRNLMNLSAMVGLFILGMKRAIDNQIARNKSMLYKKSHLIRNIIIIITSNSRIQSRGNTSKRTFINRRYNYYLSIKLVKYFAILFVGWLFGRIGGSKKSQQSIGNDDDERGNDNNVVVDGRNVD